MTTIYGGIDPQVTSREKNLDREGFDAMRNLGSQSTKEINE